MNNINLRNKFKRFIFTPILLMLILVVFINVVSSATLEVAHYTFNETSGTTLTDIAGSNDGTNNGATINQTGKINKAYDFETDDDDYIGLSSIDTRGDYSFTAWVKTEDVSALQVIFSMSEESLTDGIVIAIYNNKIYANNKEENQKMSSITLSNDTWYHIAVTKSSSSVVKIYIDNVDRTTTADSYLSLVANTYIGKRSPGYSGFDGLIDDTRIYDFDLNSDDIALIYNDGNGTEESLADLRSATIIESKISNPVPPVYPTISYDWNGSFIDNDYNSDYTYEYSFGFNAIDSFDDDEIYVDTNQTLSYDQNTIKYFDLDYTPTVDQIGDVNYSFFKVYRYLDSVYDSNYTSWSADTFTVAEAISFDFNAPGYPDWAEVFYPTKDYSGCGCYQDKSYQSGVTSYKYDLGSNDTNSFDGNQEYWKSDVDITSTDGNVNAYFSHTISVDDQGKTLFAFLTIKRYYDDVYIDSATEWTDSFDINYGKMRVQFYDENCGTTLDGNVVWNDDLTIPVDDNGLAYVWLEDYLTADGQDIESVAYREVDGIVTHTERSFDYYLYLTKSYDLNYTLLPVDMGTNIEFMAKDKLGNLWTNKYLLFSKGTDDICPYGQELSDVYTQTTNTTTNSRGIRFGIEKAGYINSFDIQQQINYYDSWALYNYTMGTILDSGSGLNASTINVETSTAILLDTAYEYSIVLYNEDGSSGKYMYSNNLLDSPIVTEYISYNYGCTNGGVSCTSDNAYAIININIMDAVYYDAFFSNPIVEVTKTDDDGKATFYMLQDGNYTAVLIDEIGSITEEYFKTTVNVKKPKNEKTSALISPYDVDVGGLLEYSLSNQTASYVPINVFAGTTNYYQFSVIDYAADPSDQVYIKRNYSVRAPMGLDYSDILEIQPYLLSKEDGVIPKVYVLDQLREAVPNALLLVIKNIDGVDVIVESLSTISTGSASISFYPLDYYTIQVWYDEILKATYSEQFRESTDLRYYTIDLYTDSVMDKLTYLVSDLSFMKSSFNPNDTNDFIVQGDFTLNYGVIDSYDIRINQNNSNVYTYSLGHGSSVLNINKTIEIGDLIDTDYPSFDVNIGVNYSYNGTEYEKFFVKNVVITKSSYNLVELLGTVPSAIGRIWAVLLAMLLTGFAVFGLTNTIGMEPLVITIVAILILSIFAFLGWFETGIVLFGADVGTSSFVLVCISIFYFMFKR